MKWARRNPLAAGLGAVVVALAALGAGLLWVRYEERETARETERQLLQSKYDDAEAARATEHRQRLELERAFAAERVARARALWNGDHLDQAEQVLASVAVEQRDAAWHALRHEMYAEVASPPIPLGFGRVMPSPDGKRLAFFGGRNPVVLLADVGSPTTGAKLELQTYGGDAAFSADGNRLVVLPISMSDWEVNQFKTRYKRDPFNRLATWDLTTNRLLTEWDIGLNDTSVLSADGRRAASCTGTRIIVRDTATNQVVAELADPVTKGPPVKLMIDRRGERLAAIVGHGMTIWDVAARRVVDRINVKDNTMLFGRFSPTGNVFVWLSVADSPTTPNERVHHLNGRDIETRADLYRILTPTQNLLVRTRFVFSPNGRVFAFEEQNLIRLHDTRSGHHLVTLRGHAHTILDLTFAPDGKKLYSLGLNSVLKTWDVRPWVE